MITIAGAGVAGLATAYELIKHGHAVTVYEIGAPGENSCSRYAGGMLAPWCEGATAEPEVVRLGQQAASWWDNVTTVEKRGTLVVAPTRDNTELTRFVRRTQGHKMVRKIELQTLEPAIAERFSQGLFFEDEAYLNPRKGLRDLTDKIQSLGGKIIYETPAPNEVDLNCTGIAANLPNLRSVRGEMAIIEAPDIQITRTIRLLHPRIPLYIVPRGQGVYMVGATMIESNSNRPVTLRSLMELLGAAYTVHPGFAEAAVLETGAGLRPAFPDNMPALSRHNGTLHLNGFYRHGFLLAPAMARKAMNYLIPESSDADHLQCQTV